MCGLTGFQKGHPEGSLEPDFFKNLLLQNDTRGRDSCGIVVFPDRSEQPSIFHSLGSIKEVLERGLIKPQEIADYDPCIVLAHTRKLTQGQATLSNAHPITVGKVTGIHNGTIKNFAELDKELGLNRPEGVEVDSWTIFAVIDSLGVAGLEKLQGTFCIAWVHTDEPTKLNLVSHGGENGIHVLQTHENRELYFHSLRLPLSRSVKTDELYAIEDDHHYVYENAKRVEKTKLSLIEHPRQRTVSRKSYVSYDTDELVRIVEAKGGKFVVFGMEEKSSLFYQTEVLPQGKMLSEVHSRELKQIVKMMISMEKLGYEETRFTDFFASSGAKEERSQKRILARISSLVEDLADSVNARPEHTPYLKALKGIEQNLNALLAEAGLPEKKDLYKLSLKKYAV